LLRRPGTVTTMGSLMSGSAGSVLATGFPDMRIVCCLSYSLDCRLRSSICSWECSASLSPGRGIDVYLCQFPAVDEVAFATLVAMSVCTSKRGELPSYVVGVRSHCSRRPQVVLDMSKYNMSRKSISWKPVVVGCSVGLRHVGRGMSAAQQSRNV